MLLWSSRPEDSCMGQCGIDIVQLSGDKGCDSCPRVGVLEQCNGLITGSVRRKNATTPLVSGVLLVGRLHCKEMRSLTSPARRTQRHQKYKCGANLNHCSCPLRPSPPTPEVVLSASKEPLLSPGAAPSAPISTSPNSHPAPLGRVRHPGRDPTCTIDALPGEGRHADSPGGSQLTVNDTLLECGLRLSIPQASTPGS